MRRPMVAANWKMNGSKIQVDSLLNDILSGLDKEGWDGRDYEVVICPPGVYLAQAQEKLVKSQVRLGAQNVHEADTGAYTGEIAAPMLKDFDCVYVLAGHSERRQYFGESSELVAEKFAAIQRHGLVPVLCVGESQQQREADETEQVILEQLEAVTKKSGAKALRQAVIAYEPVWAIGTGLTAKPDQAQAVHKVIRDYVADLDRETAESLRIIYGGSVKADNAPSLFEQTDIDGALVGGASLKAAEFLGICGAMGKSG